MAQSWFRTHPLRWLKLVLRVFIGPFTNAKTLKVYATNGYYLLGIFMLFAVILAWPIVSVLTGYIPIKVKISISSFLVGWGIRKEWVPLVCLLIAYLATYLIKPLRYFLGELTANVFFGIIDFAVRIGEWCLEHRWWSLALVVALTGVISGGAYHLFGQYRQNDRVRVAFKVWLTSVDRFVYFARVTEDQGTEYREVVDPLWNDEYERVIPPVTRDNPHPALVLHKIIQAIYGRPGPTSRDAWHEFLKNKREELRGYVRQYRPRPNMEPEEKQAWALMNIFMGRFYHRLADASIAISEPPETKRDWLLAARNSFLKIDASFDRDYQEAMRNGDENEAKRIKGYTDAARNGLGTIYATVIRPPLRLPPMFWSGVSEDARRREIKDICEDERPETCANKAYEAYSQVTDAACSYEGRRRENNTLDLFGRVAMNYDELDPNRLQMDQTCIKDKAALASCIEKRIKDMMTCVAGWPHLWVPFLTIAQSYAASTRLTPAAPSVLQARAAAAGKYFRLAYAFNAEVQKNPREWKLWNLCHFYFATEENTDLAKEFWRAFESTASDPLTALEPMPKPDKSDLISLIRNEKCHRN
jgi:hypothetical protein